MPPKTLPNDAAPSRPRAGLYACSLLAVASLGWQTYRYRQPPGLPDAGLSHAVMRGSVLRGMNLRRAALQGADLSRADLEEADLSGADLRSARLENADLRRANLRHADLRQSDLRGADLGGADLDTADLRGALYDARTTWPAGFDPSARGAVLPPTRGVSPAVRSRSAVPDAAALPDSVHVAGRELTARSRR